jgi:hypothetical protein
MMKNYLSEAKTRDALVKKLAAKKITAEEVLHVLLADQKYPPKRAAEVLKAMLEQAEDIKSKFIRERNDSDQW